MRYVTKFPRECHVLRKSNLTKKTAQTFFYSCFPYIFKIVKIFENLKISNLEAMKKNEIQMMGK